jgi:hypothetical protein
MGFLRDHAEISVGFGGESVEDLEGFWGNPIKWSCLQLDSFVNRTAKWSLNRFSRISKTKLKVKAGNSRLFQSSLVKD